MKQILRCASIALLTLLTNRELVVGQSLSRWCATDENTAALARTFHDPKLAAERATAETLSERLQRDDVFAQQFRALRPAGVAVSVVPVVVHVVTPCGSQSLPQSGIERGLAQLNADWNRTNTDANQTRADFLPYAASLGVEFRFAKLDPLGNPFNGINRVTNVATDAINPRDLVKTAVPAWDGYFNIWIVDEIYSGTPGSIILGYAQFPGTGPWNTWGIVMRYDDWSMAPLANGRTASHEVGHCFNLFHSFTDGGGCGSNCINTADRVCDTPPSTAPAERCYRNSPRNTCSNEVASGTVYTTNVPDQDENFMSYNDCQNMFTRGQKARVDAAIAAFPYIQNLISETNLLRTGVADGQVVPAAGPVAYLNSCLLTIQGGEVITCVDRPVSFRDASYGTPITGVEWQFTNATPATSTSPNPVVVFTTPGAQTATLTPIGPNGPGTPLTIQVRVLPLGQITPVAESFEVGGELTSKRWRNESSVPSNSRRWLKVGLTGTNVTTQGDSAVMIANGAVPVQGVNTLYSPPFDTRSVASTPPPVFKFDMAYAQRYNTSNDKLRVSFSANCGESWTQLMQFSGAGLSTTSGVNIPNFTPTALGQWQTQSYTLPNQFLNQPSVLVRFESESGTYGNNLYLDNIRIEGVPLGVAAELAGAGVALAPNPLTPETGLRFSLAHSTRVALRVADVLGRPVLTQAARDFAPGEHHLTLAARLRGAAAGVYVVTLELDGRVYSQKLLVQ